MCGLFVSIAKSKDFNPQTTQLIQVLESLRHRGPDGQYLYIEGQNSPKLYDLETLKQQHSLLQSKILMGHTRLSINDLSEHAHQPMISPDHRYVLVFNGEIYNFRTLRKELETDYTFVTRSDSEVIIAAYHKWGTDCVKKFNGMWAFILWDRQEQKLFVSRDRMGVKPLYIYEDDHVLMLSSEIKSFRSLRPLLPYKKNVMKYLISDSDISDVSTEFQKVSHFPCAAWSLTNLNEGLKPQIFWQLPPYRAELDKEVYNEAVFQKKLSEFYELYKDAVHIRMMSDVKFGSALSGGIDSSSIVQLAYENAQIEGDTSRQYTFSNIYRDPELKMFDESYFVNVLAQRLKLNSLVTSPIEKDFISVATNKVRYIEHLWQSPEIASYYVYQLPHQNNIKITLDGQGSDEQTGGYTGFWKSFCYTFPLRSWKQNVPYSKGAHALYSILGVLRIGNAVIYFKNILRALNDSFWSIFIRLHYSPLKILKSAYLFPRPDQANVRLFMRWKFVHTLKNLICGADANSMQFSVESRMPFLDYRIVEFFHNLPTCYLFHNGYNKYILRKAFENKLPDEIIWRKDKRGFDDPDQIWLAKEQSENRKWADNLILQNKKDYQISPKKLRIIFKYNFALYMRLLFFNIWLQSDILTSDH